jgi:hypothetical protein
MTETLPQDINQIKFETDANPYGINTWISSLSNPLSASGQIMKPRIFMQLLPINIINENYYWVIMLW